ncbi:hypothetical protein [Agrobacterium sp. S2/73]|nr:hypothetical protein [Agrobacterium sp. S2/73]
MSDEPFRGDSATPPLLEDELSAAPLLQGWVLADNGHGWMHG